MDKKLKKRIIKYQNRASKGGGYIPSVAEVRLILERKDAENES